MLPPQTFHLFAKLPPEIRAIVWKFHLTRRGIRHYIVVSPRGRHYAAIDIETDTVLDTIITKSMMEKCWPDGPVRGERDSCIRLIGGNLTPEPGSLAKSIVTVNHTRSWRKRSSPYIRIDFRRDLVYFGRGDPCLRPLFSLRVSVEPHSYEKLAADRTHWLRNVRHLAIQLDVNTSSLSPGDEVALKRLWYKSKLKTLYLVSYRDPKCPYGPPRQWRNFSRGALDEHNFLPVDEFIKLHPTYPEIRCCCNLKTINSKLIKEKLQHWPRSGTAMVKIDIVVDPY
ncbi:hypothetical protein F5X99DRAFT_401111 [Biscogniauxia marginata]|nr:hypothetical protein F5X99DRAFT_401111 [Biscogniauxia marginata]